VTCANGGQLVSTATDIINFHRLPTAAKTCHKFPDNQLVDPLLSLGKLTEHGCRVIFKRDTVEVTNSDCLLVLVGQKPIGRNIYTVPLPLGQSQNIPQNIPRTLTVKVPKNRRDNPARLPTHPSHLPYNFAQRKFGTRLSRRFAPTRSYVGPRRGPTADDGFVSVSDTDGVRHRRSGPSCRPGPVCLLLTVKDCSSAGQQKTVGICLAGALIAVKQG